jgi:hypothetical protein
MDSKTLILIVALAAGGFWLFTQAKKAFAVPTTQQALYPSVTPSLPAAPTYPTTLPSTSYPSYVNPQPSQVVKDGVTYTDEHLAVNVGYDTIANLWNSVFGEKDPTKEGVSKVL